MIMEKEKIFTKLLIAFSLRFVYGTNDTVDITVTTGSAVDSGTTSRISTVPPTLEPFQQRHPYNITLEKAYYTYLKITWEAPLGDPDSVVNYVVYHTDGNATACPLEGEHVSREVDNTTTQWVLKSLKPGSMYSVCVEANYDDAAENAFSNSYQFITDGYGGTARPCPCDPDKAATCDTETGACNCGRNLTGKHCTECIDGYFIHGQLGCEPCGCEKDRTYGTCNIDETSGLVNCDCKDNYSGPKCYSCAEGFFTLNRYNGKCMPCHCNKNTDPNSERICEPHSGVCIGCWFNTTGDECDRCKEGFTGHAHNRTCVPIPSSHRHHHQDDAPTIGTGGIVVIALLVGAIFITIAVAIIYYNQRHHKHRADLWSVQLHDEGVNFSQMMEGQELDDDPLGRKLEKTEQRLHLNINGVDKVYRSVDT